MTNIDIKYSEILSKKYDIEVKINDLLTTVENISSECKKLTSENSWEGNISNAFADLEKRLFDFATIGVLNFKNTNAYKEIAVNVFKANEKNIQKKYL